MRLRFPEKFFWGVSSSAQQFEGGNCNSQWHTWESQGRARSGECCGAACNWWENAEEDFDRAAGLGINALRLSLEWSRLEPRPGEWDKAAFHRYHAMLEALQRRGITPFLCLHHFTHPAWFESQGSFLAPGAHEIFGNLVRRAVGEFGDLCRHWVTFNEPNVFVAFAHVLGELPPGQHGNIPAALRLLAAMLRAHGHAYDLIHLGQPRAEVGLTLNYVVFAPLNPASQPDQFLANACHALFNTAPLTLLQTGKFPQPWTWLTRELLEAVNKLDYVGVNVYNRLYARFAAGTPLFSPGWLQVPPDVPQGDPGLAAPYGEAYPAAITEAVRHYSALGRPMYVLENGVPDRSDRIRPWLLVNSLGELAQCIRNGQDVRGYFHWSLVDNFEWNEGWALRFGFYELDPTTQVRTERPSARLFARIIKENAISDELLEQYANPPEPVTARRELSAVPPSNDGL